MDTIDAGKQAVDEILLKHGDTMLDRITTIDDKWTNRPKSNLVKYLMNNGHVGVNTIAKFLNRSVPVINNKLNRDSFSFDDLVAVAHVCGYSFALVNNHDPNEALHVVDVVEYFRGYDDNILQQLKNANMKAAIRNEKYEEYQKKLREVQQMKDEFGF